MNDFFHAIAIIFFKFKIKGIFQWFSRLSMLKEAQALQAKPDSSGRPVFTGLQRIAGLPLIKSTRLAFQKSRLII